MNKSNVMLRLTEAGVVPVVRASSQDIALRIVEALMEGGIPVAEITMTVPGAVQLIARCRALFGDQLIVGAGSITAIAQCTAAIDAGSRFIVTPTLKPQIIRDCNHRKRLVIAGALTPTEILGAWEAGADAVKVFPAKVLGGPAYIRMVHDPLPHIPLVPTGGVTDKTLADYFKAGVPFVGAGTDLVGKGDAEGANREALVKRARQYVSLVRSARQPGASKGAAPLPDAGYNL
jgi:2-dehydro-3-deoxyphosphogluconate aldolase/(4S)-4-hydroxy-2-oxoglutarate aldolase